LVITGSAQARPAEIGQAQGEGGAGGQAQVEAGQAQFGAGAVAPVSEAEKLRAIQRGWGPPLDLARRLNKAEQLLESMAPLIIPEPRLPRWPSSPPKAAHKAVESEPPEEDCEVQDKEENARNELCRALQTWERALERCIDVDTRLQRESEAEPGRISSLINESCHCYLLMDRVDASPLGKQIADALSSAGEDRRARRKANNMASVLTIGTEWNESCARLAEAQSREEDLTIVAL
jgi:hypothetical protein